MKRLDRSHQVHKRSLGEVFHPEREPREILDQQKRTMGSMAFSAQYQQRPVPAEGNLMRRAWFRSYAVAAGDEATRSDRTKLGYRRKSRAAQ